MSSFYFCPLLGTTETPDQVKTSMSTVTLGTTESIEDVVTTLGSIHTSIGPSFKHMTTTIGYDTTFSKTTKMSRTTNDGGEITYIVLGLIISALLMVIIGLVYRLYRIDKQLTMCANRLVDQQIFHMSEV